MNRARSVRVSFQPPSGVVPSWTERQVGIVVADAGGGEGDDAGDASDLHRGHEGAGGVGVEPEGAPAGRADRGNYDVLALRARRPRYPIPPNRR
jgi:hypothetical protein